MSETANYQLYITDDDTTKFLDWRRQINGPDNSNMVKIDAALAGKAQASTAVLATLSANSWTGASAPYTQTVSISCLTEEQNGNISVAPTSSAEQRAAAREALLSVTAQANGSLTIAADGDRPAVDIPVIVILLG